MLLGWQVDVCAIVLWCCSIDVVCYNGHMATTHPDPARSARRRLLVVGGLTRLEREYRSSLPGIRVDVANVDSSRLKNAVGEADAVVIIVSHVSHAAVARVQRQARRNGVPVFRSTSSAATALSRLIGEGS